MHQKLISHAEKLVQKKYDRKRAKEMERNKKIVSHKVEYQIKNKHVEQGVEECLRYFDDTNNAVISQLKEIKK